MRPTKETAAEQLVLMLPPRLGLAGERTVRQVIKALLPKMGLTLRPNHKVMGLDESAFQKIMIHLEEEGGASYGSRQRYRYVLLCMAEIWQQAGLIERVPQLTLSPQHPRRLAVRFDRLGRYRFSDYQCLLQWLVDGLGGKSDGLVPEGLANNVEAWTVLVLILAGVCRTGAIKILTLLQPHDLPTETSLPLRLPHLGRHGYVWLWLPPIAQLMLLTATWRARQTARPNLFTTPAQVLRKSLRSLLADVCTTAGIPALRPIQLLELVRLELRQILPNTLLAALLGMIRFAPVPADQVREVLQTLTGSELPPIPVPLGPDEDAAVSPALLPPQSNEAPTDDTPLETAYARLLKELRPALRVVFTESRPLEAMGRLQSWAQATPPLTAAQTDLPHYNLGWLVRWLLSLVDDKGLTPASREVYWNAAKRVLRELPSLALYDIDTAALELVLENRDAPGSHPMTRAAWKRLWGFLQKNGLPVPAINWRKLKVRFDSQPARVITPRILAYLLDELERLQKVELKTAAWLAARAGLRVSEVCRLRARDLVLEGLPYLLAVRSKRGRSRRVSLEHFRPEELEMLRQLQQSLLSEGENPHLLSDQEGQPLESKRVSAEVGAVLAQFNPAEQAKAERHLSFHSLRAFAAEFFFWLSQDIRYAALQLGHALAATTAGSYLHTLDLRTAPLLQARLSPLNRPDLHVPIALLAVLLDRSPQRIMQIVQAFNTEASQACVELRTPDALPDGPRPKRAGRPALFLSVTDALRLTRCLLANQRE